MYTITLIAMYFRIWIKTGIHLAKFFITNWYAKKHIFDGVLKFKLKLQYLQHVSVWSPSSGSLVTCLQTRHEANCAFPNSVRLRKAQQTYTNMGKSNWSRHYLLRHFIFKIPYYCGTWRHVFQYRPDDVCNHTARLTIMMYFNQMFLHFNFSKLIPYAP